MNKHTKRFIASALIYFFIGCSLGVAAVLNPDLIYLVRPIHAHINLLGWVSMMIIGVSYFVIPVFVKKHPYSDGAVTLHLILANVGIIGMALSFVLQNDALLAASAVIEAASAYLFLFNIISTAIKGTAVDEIPSKGRFLIGANDKEVDKWASSFTQAATFYFVIGCTLGAYMAVSDAGWSWFRIHLHITLLGWVTMMIYGVAYHIFPRFSGDAVRNVSLVRTNYMIANVGLILMAAAMVYAENSGNSPLSKYLIASAGLIEGVSGLLFIYNIAPSISGAAGVMGRASVSSVVVSLSCLMLGIIMGLCMTIFPEHVGRLLPVHAHLNVLGWISMMIYGVAYYIIPEFAGKKLYSQRLAMFQVRVATLGLIGFLALLPLREEYEITGLISFFALLEFAASFLFIFNITKSILGTKPTLA